MELLLFYLLSETFMVIQMIIFHRNIHLYIAGIAFVLYINVC